jgi:phospholipase/lecithinase/hemolysin
VYYSARGVYPSNMRRRILAVSIPLLMLPFFAAIGDPVSQVNQIVAFGDSLTDTGNASIATLGVDPGAGYAYRTLDGLPFQVGEYANPPAPGGPSGLWIDQFATKAGLPDPQPSLAPGGGTNYAVASAQTGSNNLYYVSDQLNTYLAGRSSVPSTSLYSFWAGANDIIAGNSPVTAADNLEANIATLAGEGGKYFLWFNLPLLGNTPRGQASGDAAALNAASTAFDTEWAMDVQNLDKTHPGIILVGVDIETLFNNILQNPGKYGITNTGSEPQGAALNGYLFSFDGLHPTSFADQFIADLALADFEAAVQPGGGTVPEPTSAALALLGIASVLFGRTLRRPSRSTWRR